MLKIAANLLLLQITLVTLVQKSQAQFPVLAESLLGSETILTGVKNVIGGLLAFDSVHNQCMQKTLCSEFADEIIEATAELDPVKRTFVYKPKIVQRKGRLRWMGDTVFNAISGIGRRLGLASSNRRQAPTALAAFVALASTAVQNIPLPSVVHALDFFVDVSHVMERKGAVYPFVRAGALGYGLGHRRSDNLPNGVCGQIAPDCGGWWDHLETTNQYDGGAISRKVAKSSVQRDGDAGGTGQQWNVMEPKDFLEPRVFLCKAGRFLENLNSQMGGEGVVKERLGNEKFEESCDPNDLRQTDQQDIETESGTESTDQGDVIIADEGPFDEGQVEIIEAKGYSSHEAQDGAFHDLPILVFEGLPEPTVDQTEEELVQSVLEKQANVSQHSVRTALRLPILQSNGKSLVIVEMDTIENEEKVINRRSDIRKNPRFDHVGIRKAQYQELWKFIEELTIAKRVVASPTTEVSTMTTTADEASADEAEIADIIELDSAQFPSEAGFNSPK